MSGLAWILAQQQRVELVWKNAPARWAVFLMIVGLVLLVTFIYRREKGAPGPVRALLALMRIAALLALLLVYFNPSYESKATRYRKSAVIVLVDESLSMTLSDRYDKAQADDLWTQMAYVDEKKKPLKRPAKLQRIDIVNRLMDPKVGTFLAELKKRNDVELYAFSGDLYPNIQPGKTKPQGRKTQLGDALQSLIDQPRDRRIAAVVVLTDGQSNADELPPLDAAKLLAEKKIPLYTVGIGSPTRPKDVALLRLSAREKALAGDKVTFSLELTQQGYDKGRNVRVTLEDISAWVKTTGTGMRKHMVAGQPLQLDRPGKILKVESVALGDSGALVPVKFVRAFERDGVYFLRVKVDKQQGEEQLGNNQLIHRIEIRDDRLRVLYIDGGPRWEWRAFRNWLVRDPKITSHIVMTRADDDWPQERSDDAEDLKTWPPTRDELFKYHVVVLGEVDSRNLGLGASLAASQQFFKDLALFVEKRGGGLVMVAGERYNPAAYESSPIRNLLPVKDLPDSDARVYTESMRIARTRAGRTHPAMQLDDDPGENQRTWEDRYVGFFMWYNRVKPAPGASVLAVHPKETYLYKPRTETRPEERRSYPIFVLRNYGRGKVFFSATDETWRWRFLRGDKYFRRFWSQVIRYVGAPSLFGESFHYKLWTDHKEYEPGKRVKVTLEVLDREFNPTRDQSWKLNARDPSGKQETYFLAAVKGTPGKYTGVLYATFLGRWELWVDKDPRRGINEDARVNFDVRLPDIESRRPELNRQLLVDLAKRTDGKYFEAWETSSIPPLIKKVRRQRAQTMARSRSAWNLPWVLALILGLLVGEWFLRKLFRLK